MGWNPQQDPPSNNSPYGTSAGTSPTEPDYPSANNLSNSSAQAYFPVPSYPPFQGAPHTAQGTIPLPLGQALRELPKQYLKVLDKPRVQTFEQEQSKASWDIIWIQLLTYTTLAAVLTYLARYISSFAFHTSILAFLNNGSLQLALLGASIRWNAWIPVAFFIFQGLFYLLSRVFGGDGTFLRQTYTSLLVIVPIGLIVSFIGPIPFVGLFSIVLVIYAIVLNILSLMAVHHLSGKQASTVVLIPFTIALSLLCALMLGAFKG